MNSKVQWSQSGNSLGGREKMFLPYSLEICGQGELHLRNGLFYVWMLYFFMSEIF